MNAPGDYERPTRGKKRKGGLHQRMARVAEELGTPSALYMLLMTMLAQGMLSGAQGHQIAVICIWSHLQWFGKVGSASARPKFGEECLHIAV